MAATDDEVTWAKIEGNYSDYLDLMQKKHKIDTNADVMLVDSFDGAVHSQNAEEQSINVLSFSSQMCTNEMLWSGHSTGQSINILTWCQLLVDKKRSTIFPAVENVYAEKSRL